ncbi:MAG: hypothetical protein VX936_06910, partial [Planctomycetota bacterium]|nr:hypothetical protein [Planctomycetota bacterium]
MGCFEPRTQVNTRQVHEDRLPVGHRIRYEKTAIAPVGSNRGHFENLRPMQRWESLGERRGSCVLSTSHLMILAYPKK